MNCYLLTVTLLFFSLVNPYNAKAQDFSDIKAVYTVGMEKSRDEHWNATVWLNGEKLHTLSSGWRNSIAVKATVSDGKVYVFGWERAAIPTTNYKVWCDGKEIFNISSVDHKCNITSMAVSSGDVYLGGKVYENDRWAAAVWKNGNILHTLEGNADAEVKDIYIVGNTVYSVVTEGDEDYYGKNDCIIKVFEGTRKLYDLTKGKNRGNATSVSVSDGNIFVSGYEIKKDVAVSTVWKNGRQLYTFGNKDYATYVNSVYVSANDVYAVGYMRDKENKLHSSSVWKNGKQLYDLGKSVQALSVVVADSRVYVTGNRIEKDDSIDMTFREGRVWCDGKELYHLGYNTLTESSCIANADKKLVVEGLQGTGDNRHMQTNPDDLIIAVGQKDKSSARNATVWVNGMEAYNISPSDENSRNVTPVTASVVGKDLYIFGYERDKNIKRHYKVWKNKKILYHLFDDDTEANVGSAFISDTNTYIGGYRTVDEKRMATLWKNSDVLYRFDTENNASVVSVAVSGKNMYSVVLEKSDDKDFIIRVMKDNKELYLLNDGKELCIASQMVVIGNDVYVVGHRQVDNLLTPVVWKNGIETFRIHNGKDHTMITSIVVNEGNIYACGHTLDTDLEKILEAKVWKNDTELYSFKDNIELTSVFAYKGSIYIAGMENIDKKTIGKVWKDGLLLYQLNTRNIYDDISIQSVFVMDRKELETEP